MGYALNKAEKKFTFKIHKLHRSFQNMERKKCPQNSTELCCVLVFLNEACVGVGVVLSSQSPVPRPPTSCLLSSEAQRSVLLAWLHCSAPATTYC